jgi:polysaccharide biosynthesis transport protein
MNPPLSHPDAAGLEAPVRSLYQRLLRHKRLIGAIFLLSTAASVIFVELATPHYTAQVILAVGVRRQDLLANDRQSSSSSDQPTTTAAVWTEVTRLQSWTLADNVLQQLGLMDDPEINPPQAALSELGAFGRARAWLGEQTDALLSSEKLANLIARLRRPAPGGSHALEIAAARQVPDDARMEPARIRAIQVFQKHLDVQPDRLSNLINVRFTAHDPQRAAWIVNDFVRRYLEQQVAVKYQATQAAVEWLTGTIQRMQLTLTNSENALETYRASAQLTEGTGGSLIAQQLAELNRQYAVVQGEEALARSRLRQIEMQHDPATVSSLADPQIGVHIQQLRTDRIRVNQELGAARSNYGNQHPEVAKLQRQLAEIDSMIAREGRNATDSARAMADAATARREALEQRLDTLQKRLSVLAQSEVQLRELQREADANRAVYEPFLTKVKDLTARLEVQQPDASIVSPALVPLSPSFPQKAKTIGLIGFGSLIIGALVALLIEMYRSGFDNVGQIERVTGFPALGAVPRIPLQLGYEETGFGGRRTGAIYAEAIQSIRSSMDSGPERRRRRTVMVTSAVPGEGKSTCAASLARMAAICGERVLLIDGDLANPSLHEVMQVSSGTGLTSLLKGEAELSQVVYSDAATPMHYILAGAPLDTPNDLLGSRQMENLLQELKDEYELVVIDCSPLLAVSDPRRLARLVDDCIMVVAWDRTPIQTVMAALRQLRMASSGFIGIVLSQVDLQTYLRFVTGGMAKNRPYFRRLSRKSGDA